jgi:hypothetical protein
MRNVTEVNGKHGSGNWAIMISAESYAHHGFDGNTFAGMRVRNVDVDIFQPVRRSRLLELPSTMTELLMEVVLSGAFVFDTFGATEVPLPSFETLLFDPNPVRIAMDLCQSAQNLNLVSLCHRQCLNGRRAGTCSR